jgi:hypothetical protein
METLRHQQLKVLAAGFLRAAGCCAVAMEVACPFSRYRVDVAGYADARPKHTPARIDENAAPPICLQRPHPLTVIVECKQSRADFVRDSRALDGLLATRTDLDAQRRDLEERIIRVSEPNLLRSGSMLFSELEDWDYSQSSLPSYRRVLRQMRAIDQQVHGQTKFWTLARYTLADVLLIAAPRGLLRPCEAPPGWGLVEFVPDEPLSTAGIHGLVVRQALDRYRLRLLRNIAVAGTRAIGRTSPQDRVEPALAG